MTLTVAILSPGDMGTGIARLLRAHDFRVITQVTSRSITTQTRASSAGIELLSSDVDLCSTADIILSIVPPSAALSTAKRVSYHFKYAKRPSNSPLIYVDLNAVSQPMAQRIAATMNEPNRSIAFLDGAIFGPPPSKAPRGTIWKKPRIAVSGAEALDARLCEVLNIKSIGTEIGSASALKMCFATVSKGAVGLALQSFTSAQRLGVWPELKEEMRAFSPPMGAALVAFLEKSVESLPAKAARWVREMEEIGETHAETGFAGMEMFDGVAEMFRVVAETEAGKKGEKAGVEEVVEQVGEAVSRRKKARDEKQKEDEDVAMEEKPVEFPREYNGDKDDGAMADFLFTSAPSRAF